MKKVSAKDVGIPCHNKFEELYAEAVVDPHCDINAADSADTKPHVKVAAKALVTNVTQA